MRIRANIALSEASVVFRDLILNATNQIFEAGGARNDRVQTAAPALA